MDEVRATWDTTKLFTAEELFWMPGDEPWELWEGALRKVPGSGALASSIAGGVGAEISLFVRPRGLGLVTAANGGYILARNPDTVLAPDVGFVRWDRLPGRVVPEEYCPVPPDLAVEVLTLWNVPGDIDDKTRHYRKAGVPLLWWVDPQLRTVTVYRHGVLAAELREGDVLDGDDVLPGFTLPVSQIFE
jgi:Uma2 family endonuclease